MTNADLVARLRAEQYHHEGQYYNDPLATEAADAIERLEAELDAANATLEFVRTSLESAVAPTVPEGTILSDLEQAAYSILARLRAARALKGEVE